jgi:hypothetical protein
MSETEKKLNLDLITSKLEELKAHESMYRSWSDPRASCCRAGVEALELALISLKGKNAASRESQRIDQIHELHAFVKELGGHVSAEIFRDKDSALKCADDFESYHTLFLEEGEVSFGVARIECSITPAECEEVLSSRTAYLFIRGFQDDYSVDLFSNLADAVDALDEYNLEYPDYEDPDRGLCGLHTALISNF